MTAPAATPAGAVLEMRAVTVASSRDPAATVLEDVNWTVRRGDYWVIGGLHRSGKSDLLAVAAGLLRPTRGEARLFACDPFGCPEGDQLAVRRRVGFVFDGGQLLHDLSLEDNVALPLRYHLAAGEAEPVEHLHALIELTGLKSWADRRPGEVSRNWQQRFGLARALALRPELLLLDDPLSGLDPRDAGWWIETLAALAAGHALLDGHPLTLAMSTNDLRPCRGRARQFALLQDRSFIVLDSQTGFDSPKQPALTELLRPWNV